MLLTSVLWWCGPAQSPLFMSADRIRSQQSALRISVCDKSKGVNVITCSYILKRLRWWMGGMSLHLNIKPGYEPEGETLNSPVDFHFHLWSQALGSDWQNENAADKMSFLWRAAGLDCCYNVECTGADASSQFPHRHRVRSSGERSGWGHWNGDSLSPLEEHGGIRRRVGPGLAGRCPVLFEFWTEFYYKKMLLANKTWNHFILATEFVCGTDPFRRYFHWAKLQPQSSLTKRGFLDSLCYSAVNYLKTKSFHW